MNPNLHFAPRTFPARIAELGFTASLPADWISHELPEDEVDFSDPTALVPLAVVTAPHAAIVLAIAARPAHDDGTLHDWAWYHLQQQQLQARAVGRDAVAGVAAVSGEAVQDSDLGPMCVRFAFLEDGGRLVILTLTAPELFASAVQEAWFELVRSFTLTSPRGSRFAVEPHADLEPAAAIPEPWLDRELASGVGIEGAEAADGMQADDDETGRGAEEGDAAQGPDGAGDPPGGDEGTSEIETVLEFYTDGRPPELRAADGSPMWWHEALAMEAAGRPDEAEAHIRSHCPYIGYAASIAEMYRQRMLRLQRRGDAEGALQAFVRASSSIGHYASMATSGGEGAALSLERDRFRAGLVADYGGDPEAHREPAGAGR